jgi:hypothetical protein
MCPCGRRKRSLLIHPIKEIGCLRRSRYVRLSLPHMGEHAGNKTTADTDTSISNVFAVNL